VALLGCGRVGFTSRASSDALDDSEPLDAAIASCAALEPTCGPNGTTSCCASLPVPGGTFYRSVDRGDDAMYADTNYPATVSAYRLDTYEVTVARFRAFVDAGYGTATMPPPDGAGALPNVPASGWDPTWNSALSATTADLRLVLQCEPTYQTWTDVAGTNDRRPMNCVSWYLAMAFCIWDGGRLPSDAEWNFAAAGGDEQRVFPPSTSTAVTLAPSQASFAIGTDCVGDGLTGCVIDDFLEVGTRPAGNGRWGHADLAGNVWEWTLDAYGFYIVDCVDCAQTTGTDRTLRGGGFANQLTQLRTGYRNPFPRDYQFMDTGVRCAR
jgi:formylglycine-generating enzyme required for sulfatase activity